MWKVNHNLLAVRNILKLLPITKLSLDISRQAYDEKMIVVINVNVNVNYFYENTWKDNLHFTRNLD